MGTPLSKDEISRNQGGQSEVIRQRSRSRKNIFPRRPITISSGSSWVPRKNDLPRKGSTIFFIRSYRIKSQSDRMAYRLEGPRIIHRGKADIISEPLMPGAIQVPNDGCPIILMVDGQTTGGYAKIANVISADIPVLAQKMPGESFRFEAVDLDRAYEALEGKGTRSPLAQKKPTFFVKPDRSSAHWRDGEALLSAPAPKSTGEYRSRYPSRKGAFRFPPRERVASSHQSY